MNYTSYAAARKAIDKAINVCGNERASSPGTVFPISEGKSVGAADDYYSELLKNPEVAERMAKVREARKVAFLKSLKEEDKKVKEEDKKVAFLKSLKERGR